MSDSFYEEMRGVATELLGEFLQGVVQLVRVTPGAPDPATPWEPGAPTETTYALEATVSRVAEKYVDGTLIVATDNQVMFAVPQVVPTLADKLLIDGTVQVMKDLRPIPGAGVTVAYIAFVAR